MIKAENLIKRYGDKEVLKGINLNLKKGEIVGFLGPNGAGKTTAFSIIIGLIKANEGRVFFEDIEITNYHMYQRAHLGMTFLPQEHSVFREISVENNILLVLERTVGKPEKRGFYLESLLNRFGLQKVRRQKAKTLSGGEKRRLEIARALATFPKYIFLDEPFTGVDPIAISKIQNLILGFKEEGIGVIVSDHNIRETLKITDRAYILVNGEILKEGTPDEIVSDPIIKEKYLGKEIRIN